MEAICNIQVLLQAAEFLERRERGKKIYIDLYIDRYTPVNNNTSKKKKGEFVCLCQSAQHKQTHALKASEQSGVEDIKR